MEQLDERRGAAARNGPSSRQGIFAPGGEFWTISYEGLAFTLKSVLGLTYLKRLLQNPGVEIRARDLAMGPGAGVGNEAHARQLQEEGEEYAPRRGNYQEPVIDDRGLRAYKARITDLREELEDVVERGGAERAEEIRSEIAEIVRTIKTLLDKTGRPRRFGFEEEQARLNVFRAIKVALQKIEKNHPALGAYFEHTIRTGLFCSYNPGNAFIDWRFSLDGAAPAENFAPLRSSLDSVTVQPLPEAGAFVGREAEISALASRLERAVAGEGRVILIGGSAGMGKSRLAQETAAASIVGGFVTRVGSCYDREDSVPFVPVVEILEAALAARGEDPEAFRAMLGDEASEIARLVPQLHRRFPDIPPPAQSSPEQSRRALFNAVLSVIARRAAQEPMLMVIEDLHWADEGTLALLVHMARAAAKLRLVILATYRDDEVSGNPELIKALDEMARLRVERIHLDGLSRAAVAELIEKLSGETPPEAFVELIYNSTEGNPFFIEELYRHLESSQGGARQTFARAEVDLPNSLKLALGRRLARVSKETLRVLGAAAVIGRSFTFALLEATTGIDPDALIDSVEEAERAGLISSWFQYPETHFRFAHELIRRAVLDELSSARRQRLHLNVAEAIEKVYASGLDEHTDDLAHHLWNAGGAAEALKTIGYLQKAGERAVLSSANREAVGHFRRAIKLVEMMPESAHRAQLKLMLHVELGTPLTAMQGFASAEVEEVWARARELCQKAGEAPQLFPVLWGLSVMHTARGKHRAAMELAEQCVRLAEKTADSGMLVAAHHALGISLSTLGEFEPALEHLEKVIGLYQPERHGALAFQYGQDFGVVARSHAALDLWHLGFPERALERNAEALKLAETIAHPYSQAAALDFAAWLHQMRRDHKSAEAMASAARKVSSDGGFAYWSSIAEVLEGASIAERGQILRAIEQIRDGLTAYGAIGGGVMAPSFLGLLANAQGQAGQVDAALATIAEAQQAALASEEHWWEPELYRIEGDLVLKRAPREILNCPMRKRAEVCFMRAMAMARDQKAKSLELRAAVSICRLRIEQRREEEGRRLLGALYAGFEEGSETADLIDARNLLVT